MRRIDSAHSHWLFDEDERRFRRVPLGADVLDPYLPWSTYHELEIDTGTGAFVVTLDIDGTKRLRSWAVDLDAPTAAGHDDEQTVELRLAPDGPAV